LPGKSHARSSVVRPRQWPRNLPDTAQPTAIEEETSKGGDWPKKCLSKTAGVPFGMTSHSRYRMTTEHQPRILVVDDDANVRASLETLLTKAGYQVVLARNGSEAARLWRDLGGDLAIIDLFMPEKDGIEAIIELRAYSPGVRIIAMSGGGANQRFDLLHETRLLGAALTISKPFASADMLAMVNRVLKGV
jgi:CheY-like chemotaxis protein